MANSMRSKLMMYVSSAVFAGSAGMALATGAWADDHGGWHKGDGDKQCDGKRHGHHSKGGYHKGGMDAGEHREKMLEHMDAELQLSDEQRDQLAVLMKSHHQQRGEHRQQMHQWFDKMYSLDPGSSDYIEQATALANERADAMVAKMVDRARLKADIYAVLNPEQQQKFRQMKPGKGKHQGMKKEGHHND